MNELLCPSCRTINPGENAECACGQRLHFPPVDQEAQDRYDKSHEHDNDSYDSELESDVSAEPEDEDRISPMVPGIILGTLLAIENHKKKMAKRSQDLEDKVNEYQIDRQNHGGVGRGETDPETGVERYL
jgi:hypothetical protein